MDWAEKMDTEMYFFPAGLKKVGVTEDDPNRYGLDAKRWESDHASIVAVVGGHASSDGMNTAGLVANVLYQSETTFQNLPKTRGRKAISMLRWVQYVLDKFATVQEVVDEFRSENIIITPALVPDEGDGDPKEAKLQLSVSDMKGDSAIIEVLARDEANPMNDNAEFFLISHNKAYRTMTNDPIYPTQIALNQYWKWQWNTDRNKHPSNTLPGSAFSPDRFSRADFYINHAADSANDHEAVAQMFSILNTVSVPLGYEIGPDDPNIAQTLWVSVSQQNTLKYYFNDILYPSTFWTDISPEGIKTIGADEAHGFNTPPGQSCFRLPNKTEQGNVIYYSDQVNRKYVRTNDPFAA